MAFDSSQPRDAEGQWTDGAARQRAVKSLARKKKAGAPKAAADADAVHETAKGKIRLSYTIEGGTPTVRAHSGDRVVGLAQFVTQGVAKDKIKGGNVRVAPDMRRLGIASAMYDHAQRATGRSYVPSDFQLDDGKHLVAAYKKRIAKRTGG